MAVLRQLSPLLVLVPIAGLFALGFIVALRSGLAGLSRGQDLRVLALNFTSVVLRVAGYLAGLFVVQRMIGAPLELGW
ncbi:MAG: hypothetical protein P4L84_37105 [Isosphaeraceae bacterium]|nr:hypothetical protein [Isosphaeraceae bacterium]